MAWRAVQDHSKGAYELDQIWTGNGWTIAPTPARQRGALETGENLLHGQKERHSRRRPLRFTGALGVAVECWPSTLSNSSLAAFYQGGNAYVAQSKYGDPGCASACHVCRGPFLECGVVFKLTPNSKDEWKQTVLHRFNDKPGPIQLLFEQRIKNVIAFL